MDTHPKPIIRSSESGVRIRGLRSRLRARTPHTTAVSRAPIGVGVAIGIGIGLSWLSDSIPIPIPIPTPTPSGYPLTPES
jgi:hypothetical protein